MAGAALILKYQWRAYWRRAIRTGQRAQFYITVFVLFAWLFVKLPATLSQAARELAVGQTSYMDALLLGLCALWLFVLVEDAQISPTSSGLMRFPLNAGSLLALRVASLFCSPVTWLAAIASAWSLYPFLLSRHPVSGGVAAIVLLAVTFSVGMSVSHLLGVARLRTKLFLPAAIIGVALGAVVLMQGDDGIRQLRASVIFSPVHLVTVAAVADTTSAAAVPVITLLAIAGPAAWLLLWSFRRSLFDQDVLRTPGRASASALWVPGRFGALVRKEQRYYRTVLDLWLGLMLVLAVAVAGLFGSVPQGIRQAVIMIALLLNANVSLNCFGLDTAEELNRYFILPLRGREIVLVKNLGLMAVVTAQLSLLMIVALWHGGLGETGQDLVLAVVLLLGQLTWGNLVSVSSPARMRFYRFSPTGSPITAVITIMLATIPGLAVIVLLRLRSMLAVAAIMGIVVLTLAGYAASLRSAGRTLERRRHIISARLS